MTDADVSAGILGWFGFAAFLSQWIKRRLDPLVVCPECEMHTMIEDDHVWVCPGCGYETSDVDETPVI